MLLARGLTSTSVVDSSDGLMLILWSISSRHGIWIDRHRDVNGTGALYGVGDGGGSDGGGGRYGGG